MVVKQSVLCEMFGFLNFFGRKIFGRKFARQIERYLDGALEIRVQYFSDEFFSCGKHISAERFIFNGFR
jgi:hypothetical protein